MAKAIRSYLCLLVADLQKLLFRRYVNCPWARIALSEIFGIRRYKKALQDAARVNSLDLYVRFKNNGCEYDPNALFEFGRHGNLLAIKYIGRNKSLNNEMLYDIVRSTHNWNVVRYLEDYGVQ